MTMLLDAAVDKFEEVLNQLNDLEAQWWPFLFLRPEPYMPISSVRVLGLATLHGVFLGMVVNILVALQGATVNPATFPVLTTLAFFSVYRTTFAFCWNRRAARMRCTTKSS